MRYLLIVALMIAVPFSASAGKKKIKTATAAEACPKIVELRRAAYRVSLDSDEITVLYKTCAKIIDESTADDVGEQLACAATALGHVGLWDCGDVVETILKQAHPYLATMHKSCVHQVDLAEAAAHATLSAEVKTTMIASCDQGMEVQEIMKSPFEMETATKCVLKASSAASSVRCWQ
ncbi:MAG: hypothetical protein ACI9MC_001839 [Kiritimatiellia bacterium]|jgi:hypothetical protein